MGSNLCSALEFLACLDSLQPLAVVLFHADPLELPRNNLNNCWIKPVAMAVVFKGGIGRRNSKELSPDRGKAGLSE